MRIHNNITTLEHCIICNNNNDNDDNDICVRPFLVILKTQLNILNRH